MSKSIATAIERIGSQSALAAAIGVTPQTVHNWVVRGRVPAEHCPAIERETGVRCESLRPDVDWAYLRGTAGQVNSDEDDQAPKQPAPAECASGAPDGVSPCVATSAPPISEAGDPRHGIDRRHPNQRREPRRMEDKDIGPLGDC